ncbi:hypothetical protein IW262DRAFT_1302343 [Armillaria fumosa]|nr:hypothetical protein IW262DRAFT_1302343 [Armillaria fumosa]
MAASHMDDADSDLNEDDGTMDINAAAGSDMGRETRDQKDYNQYLSYFECDISGYDVEAFQMALVRQRGLWRARHWYHSSSRQRGYLARVTSSVKAGVCDGLEKVIATLVSKTPMRKSIGARSGEKIYRNLYLLSMFFCCGMGQHPGIQKVRKGIKE